MNQSHSQLCTFISKAQAVHGSVYDYQHVEYVNTHTPVTIMCSSHGAFLVRPVKHISGKQGCPRCSKLNRVLNDTRFHSLEQIIEDAQSIHAAKYHYVRLDQHNSEYITTNDTLTIECSVHGQFSQTINKHLYIKTGCPKCATARTAKTRAKTLDQFVLDSTAVHGSLYGYDHARYQSAHQYITVTCPTHGNFSITPANHILQQQGCNKCAASQPERIMMQACIDAGVDAVAQYKPNGCVSPMTGSQLRFDLYIASHNLLIEYDGIYHYQPIDHGVGCEAALHKLERQQLYDHTKTQYAAANDIRLVRIPYFSPIPVYQHVTQLLRTT